MSDYLKPGDLVQSTGSQYKITDEIGSGGQGRVYLATKEGTHYALKWYNTTTSTSEQYAAIEHLIETGAPGEAFVWPMEIVEGQSKNNFGYMMPLVDTSKYMKLSHYFGGVQEIPSFEKLINVSIKLAHAFYELHLSGWCYKDISFGNIFVNFDTSDVLICDNDNVTFDQSASPQDNWGTTGFMAPEVLRGEAPPSTETDLFSLSVVLFRMLHLQHPLQGRLEYETLISDYESDLKLYGSNPIFIYDPVDETNRPVPGKKDMADAFWNKYPDFFKALFIHAFTQGLHQPEVRIRESVWIKELTRLKGKLFYCQACGNQLFYDAEQLRKGRKCPHCHAPIKQLPPRMKIGSDVILLNHDTILMQNQIDSSKLMAFDTVAGRIEIHPQRPELWGLRNLSESTWHYVLEDGNTKTIDHGDVAPLLHNHTINFGTESGVFRLATRIK